MLNHPCNERGAASNTTVTMDDFPQTPPNTTRDIADGKSMSVGVTIFILILVLAILALNITGLVAAIRVANRSDVSGETKAWAGVLSAVGWFLCPFFSIGPIVIESNAKANAKNARRATRQRAPRRRA